MATINCPTTLECPALPRVTLSQAVIDLMESIALQESALSHILCAESQKMKTALAMNEIDLCKLLEKFGLELESSKSRLIEFGRFAEQNIPVPFY